MTIKEYNRCEDLTTWVIASGFTKSLKTDHMEGSRSIELSAGLSEIEAYPLNTNGNKFSWSASYPVFGFYIKISPTQCSVYVGIINSNNGHYATLCFYKDGTRYKVSLSWRGASSENSMNLGSFVPDTWYWYEMKMGANNVDVWRNSVGLGGAAGMNADFTGAYARTFSSGQIYGTALHDYYRFASELEYPPSAPILMTQIEISNSGGMLDCDAIEWSEGQSCDPATRQVPLRSDGEFVDTGTFVIDNRQITITVRLTDAQRDTLNLIFNANATVTITVKTESGQNYPRWGYTAWLSRILKEYRYSKEGSDEREWEVELEFYCSSFSYEVSA
jgi:hypothetical protein